MRWIYYRRTRHCASLSVSVGGAYVIAHRPGHHTLGYQPGGQHGYLGEHKTWQAAKAAAEQHAQTLSKGPTHGRRPATSKAVRVVRAGHR